MGPGAMRGRRGRVRAGWGGLGVRGHFSDQHWQPCRSRDEEWDQGHGSMRSMAGCVGGLGSGKGRGGGARTHGSMRGMGGGAGCVRGKG